MKAIAKDKIVSLLDRLAKDYLLVAPTSSDGMKASFAPVTDGKDVKLDFYNSKDAPKKLFFPQSEVLFSYDKDGQITEPELKLDKKRIIFGLRPCDAKSIALLDYVFDDPEYKDPYYLEKRNQTTIFALACTDPLTSCFCTSFGIGPHSREGADVLVIDTGKNYLFDGVTEKGNAILKELKELTDACLSLSAEAVRVRPRRRRSHRCRC